MIADDTMHLRSIRREVSWTELKPYTLTRTSVARSCFTVNRLGASNSGVAGASCNGPIGFLGNYMPSRARRQLSHSLTFLPRSSNRQGMLGAGCSGLSCTGLYVLYEAKGAYEHDASCSTVSHLYNDL